MANHCDQTVAIYGQRDLVQELYTQLTGHNRFCDVVLPVPFAQSAGMNGYDWRVANWGTKCDVAEVEITHALQHSDMDPPAPVAGMSWFKFKCWTAWAPPVPVWNKLHEMGIEVWTEYEDEGLNFAGKYMFGEDTSWEPTALDDERWEPEAEEENE